MNYKELEEAIDKLLPNAQLDHDNDGQIIIYTKLTINDKVNLKDWKDQELVDFFVEEYE